MVGKQLAKKLMEWIGEYQISIKSIHIVIKANSNYNPIFFVDCLA